MNQHTKRENDIMIVSHKFKYRSKSTSIEYFCNLLDPAFEQYNGSKVSIAEGLAVRLKKLANGRSYGDWNSPYTSHSVMEEIWGLQQTFHKKPKVLFFPYADFNYHFFSLTGPFIRSKRILYSYFNTDELSNRFSSLNHFKRSEIILVTSTEVQEFLDFKFKGKGPKIIHFPLGVNTEYFIPANQNKTGEKRILISGSNRRDINLIMALIEYFEQNHPEIKFEMVGIPKLKAFSAGHKNVICHDYLDEQEFIAPYLRADIAILPLKSAASSNSLNEYIACCLPLVYTDLPGMSELELKKFGFGVPCGDESTFIKKTEALIFDDTQIKIFKQQCMAERDSLSWAAKVPEFHDIISI